MKISLKNKYVKKGVPVVRAVNTEQYHTLDWYVVEFDTFNSRKVHYVAQIISVSSVSVSSPTRYTIRCYKTVKSPNALIFKSLKSNEIVLKDSIVFLLQKPEMLSRNIVEFKNKGAFPKYPFVFQ